jgi:decaprenylphospho-beta-D-erythro-pentofuranosid-2-ulose 2-reductase
MTDTAATAATPTPAAYASRRVIVLGALSAIAMAVARIYAGENAALLLVARNADRLKLAADDLRARGAVQVETVALDLDEASVNATTHMAEWAARLGGIDDVHIVYGYLGDQETAKDSPSELAKILSVNFTSAALWASAAGEFMRAQRRGAVVAISSVAGDRGRQSNYAYGAAKGGLALFMQGLSHSLAPVGARAVAMKLGFVDTPMTDGMDKKGALWAKPDQVAVAIRRAAKRGGPIQYAPGLWKVIMLIIRTVPSFVFHRTKL